MTKRQRIFSCFSAAILLCLLAGSAVAQPVGSVQGSVVDEEFKRPLVGVTVTIGATRQSAKTNEQGAYLIENVAPGSYDLVFSKEGYIQQTLNQVVVNAGQVTPLDVELPGEYTELEPFVVQDLKLEAGSREQLVDLRSKSPSLINAVGQDLISKSGLSDAGQILTLVPGATVQDNKAVIRGLPDRYVSSQLNGVRLPSSDAETRAIELDQFPSDVIESIQVSKTFTPDQQGDASGGAVNIVTKSIPDRNIFEIGMKVGSNSQVFGKDNFLTYTGARIPFFGRDGDRKDRIDMVNNLSGISTGTKEVGGLLDYSVDATLGGRASAGDGWVIGGIASVFYSRSYDQIEDGANDKWELRSPNPALGNNPTFPDEGTIGGIETTSFFDVRESTEELQLGGLFSVGLQNDFHNIGLTYLTTVTTTDTATLSEDTRGKEFFFPGHNPDDPTSPGFVDLDRYPYLRNQTLAYEERSISSLQLRGDHTLNFFERAGGETFAFLPPKVDWTLSTSNSETVEPDRRQFGEYWQPGTPDTVVPNPFGPGFITIPGTPSVHFPLIAGDAADVGSYQRIFERVEEESEQLSLNLTLPFEQWNEREGYIKIGIFEDRVNRTFDADTFRNADQDPGTPASSATSEGGFNEFLSTAIDNGTATGDLGFIASSQVDIDYRGSYDISAWYLMTDLPLTSWLSVIGGVRFETTDAAIAASPEIDALIVLPDGLAVDAFAVPATQTRAVDPVSGLPLGDSKFQQDDVLPAIQLAITPTEDLVFRVSYTETIARQTFRELSPAAQSEFLGGDIFIGNPNLQAASVQSYDFRIDYTPYTGTFLSLSLFRKDIADTIEFVQRDAVSVGNFTTAVNFPEGVLQGIEFEIRQELGELKEELTGFTTGFNVTLIDSEVTLSEGEQALVEGLFSGGSSNFLTKREMVNTPDYLVNFNVTYDNDETGTQVGLFYTLKGETLVAGFGIDRGGPAFIPSVYAEPYDQLNFTLSQELTDNIKLKLSLKNLTNPLIEEVYRSDFSQDRLRRSRRKGIDFSISIGGEFEF